jgi:outer membrane protein TolC
MVALALLLGLPPGSLQRELDRPEPPEIPAGVPSDLRRRRPDIRQAERTLASSSVSIGAAVA